MLKANHINVYNWGNALRGMRNPFNSQHKSDSKHCSTICPLKNTCINKNDFCIGEADMALCKRLVKAGSVHRKFMRQIMISMDVTACETFWSQFDTYKVGTVANSTSKMHTLHKRNLTMDNFEHDGMTNDNRNNLSAIISWINATRLNFLNEEDMDKKQMYWRDMINLLPMSFLQTRTITMSYENAVAMIASRENHKLQEWRDFTKILLRLPYMREFLGR